VDAENLALLERLVVAVEQLLAVVVETITPPEHPADPRCLHPEDARIDLSAMGRPGRFHCRKCGYRNTED
jgi:hypothetical protein